MAALLKPNARKRILHRLRTLGCPYNEEEDELLFDLLLKPGEPRIKMLQWLLSKYDAKVADLLDNAQTALSSSKMDSRMQRLLFVCSNMGFCKYDDVDLIRGLGPGFGDAMVKRQASFLEQLLDYVLIRDSAEDPMSKSMLSPGVISEDCPLEDQVSAGYRYLDELAASRLLPAIMRPAVDLIPHDIRRQNFGSKKDNNFPPPKALSELEEMCESAEKNLERRVQVLDEWQDVEIDQTESQLQHAGEHLELVLSELSQVVVAFTYCYDNEMLTWCGRTAPNLSQLGPTCKRVHTLTKQFAKLLEGLRQIHKSHDHLSQGVSDHVKSLHATKADMLAGVGQAAANSFAEVVDVLEDSKLNAETSVSFRLNDSLCSSRLQF